MPKQSDRKYCMSKFISTEALLYAKVADLRTDLETSEQTCGQLEVHLLNVARENDRLTEENERLERLVTLAVEAGISHDG